MLSPQPLTPRQARLKRAVDIFGAGLLLLALGWLIPILAWLARRDTGEPGIFRQSRVGRHGELFDVLKIRTMRSIPSMATNVTRDGDPRITPLGAQLRRYKLDELPQLWNVLKGEMSLVGPRPDVPGYYNHLQPPEDVLLTLRPGITSPAALQYRNEELLLAEAADPTAYNDEVLFPMKVALNLQYLDNWSIGTDLAVLLRTAASSLAKGHAASST